MAVAVPKTGARHPQFPQPLKTWQAESNVHGKPVLYFEIKASDDKFEGSPLLMVDACKSHKKTGEKTRQIHYSIS